MVATDRQHDALQTIFSFFLGLMVLAFIGVGVNTYYRSPAEKYTKPQREMSREQEAIGRHAPPGGLSLSEQAKLDSLSEMQEAVNERQQAEIKDWARVTSIILVLFATLALVVSLVLSGQLRVISNGLLLGGLFTMLYGAGWVIFSGNSAARFYVICFALIVSIGLGYAKFVRGRKRTERSRPERGLAPDDGAIGELEARVAVLEKRAAAAAAALKGIDSGGV